MSAAQLGIERLNSVIQELQEENQDLKERYIRARSLARDKESIIDDLLMQEDDLREDIRSLADSLDELQHRWTDKTELFKQIGRLS